MNSAEFLDAVIDSHDCIYGTQRDFRRLSHPIVRDKICGVHCPAMLRVDNIMGIYSRLKDIERKHPVTLLGTFLTVVALLISYLAGFGFERRPHLSYSVLADANVFDLEHVLGDLDIVRNGKSIKAEGQSLRVITIKVTNDGDVDITKNLYDNNDPLGFRIAPGTIIEVPQLLQTNNDYIRKNFHASLGENERVDFQPLILDRGNYFVVKVLVLHANQDRPTVEPTGKIAGVEELAVVDQPARPPFMSQVLYGSLSVHVTRIVLYALALVAVAVSALVFTGLGDRVLTRLRRRRAVASFNGDSIIGAFVNLYSQYDDSILRGCEIILALPQTTVAPSDQMPPGTSTKGQSDAMLQQIIHKHGRSPWIARMVTDVWETLRASGNLQISGDKIVVSKEFVDRANSFIKSVRPNRWSHLRVESPEERLAVCERALEHHDYEGRELRSEIRELRSILGIPPGRRRKKSPKPNIPFVETVPESDSPDRLSSPPL